MRGSYIGDLYITRESQDDFKDITTVSGRLIIAGDIRITFKNLRVVGIFEITEGASVATPCLEVCGLVYLNGSNVWTATVLETSGSITAYADNKLVLPKLKLIDGDLTLHEASTFVAQKLEKINGDIYMDEGCSIHAPSLQKIKGGIRGKAHISFQASQLVEILGSIHLIGSASFMAEKLSKVSGTIHLRYYDDLFTNSNKSRFFKPLQIAPEGLFEAHALKMIKDSIWIDCSARLDIPNLNRTRHKVPGEI